MPSGQVLAYDRQAAVAYAHRWAYGRNPAYYDYEAIGGDCTNYASQCLYAGSGIMNPAAPLGWYYRTPNDKAPAWTGVEQFFRFLTRARQDAGPFGATALPEQCQPGDFVQLSFRDGVFQHTPIIVAVEHPVTPESTLVAAHSYDTDQRPLSSYDYQQLRWLHVLGVRR